MVVTSRLSEYLRPGHSFECGQFFADIVKRSCIQFVPSIWVANFDARKPPRRSLVKVFIWILIYARYFLVAQLEPNPRLLVRLQLALLLRLA